MRRLEIGLAVGLLALAATLALRPASVAASHSCVGGPDVVFRASDRARLVGHRFGGMRPGARTAVVLAHMSNGSLCDWAPYARSLAAKHVFVFAFDFRGHGLSGGTQNYGRLGLDIAGAVRTVRGLGGRKVIVVGASLGGIAAIVAAASIRPRVAGVAAVSAPAAIGERLNAIPSAARLQVPTLYLASEEDQNAGYDFAADARRLYDATLTGEKRLALYPGSLHGIFLVGGPAAARGLLLRFIRDPSAAVRS